MKLMIVVIAVAAVVFVSNEILKGRAEYERAEHIRRATLCVRGMLNGLYGIRRFQLESRVEDILPNSWRVRYVILCPWNDIAKPQPDSEIPWQQDLWQEFDDTFNVWFCVENLSDLPRNERYTKLLTFQGKESALDYMRQKGLDELLRVAPDTLFLVEVINSTTPWMQVGDLKLGEIPRSINPPDKLGIGSAYGYDRFVVGFVDGTYWQIGSSIPFAELEKFFTVKQAMKYDRQQVLGPYGAEVEVPTL